MADQKNKHIFDRDTAVDMLNRNVLLSGQINDVDKADKRSETALNLAKVIKTMAEVEVIGSVLKD